LRKPLILAFDVFNARGGIAKFNRDFCEALEKINTVENYDLIYLDHRIYEEASFLSKGKLFSISGPFKKIKYLVRAIFSIGLKSSHVIAAHISLLPLAFLLSKSKGIPLVLIIHGVDAWSPSKNNLVNYFCRKVDFVISVTNFTAQRFKKWSGINENKIFILPNTVNLNMFQPEPIPLDLIKSLGLNNKKIILTVARMSSIERYKGIDEIIDLMPELCAQIKDLVYLVVGDGDDRPRLIRKVCDLGLSHSVRFLGYIDEPNKADYFRLADLFVMAGWGEGFGIVYLESLACGTPVIGSKLDGSSEALKNGEFGVLVDPNDRQEVKSAILKSLSQSKSRQIPNRRQLIDSYSSENFTGKVKYIFESIK